MKIKEQSECVYRGFQLSTTNGGSEGTESRREPRVGFVGAFRELSDDRSIFFSVVWRGLHYRRGEESQEMLED